MSAWKGVRYRPDVGWEMRCESCAASGTGAAYWPLSLEFWNPDQGLTRCRACWTDSRKSRRRTTVPDAVRAEARRVKQRAYQREWRATKRRLAA